MKKVIKVYILLYLMRSFHYYYNFCQISEKNYNSFESTMWYEICKHNLIWKHSELSFLTECFIATSCKRDYYVETIAGRKLLDISWSILWQMIFMTTFNGLHFAPRYDRPIISREFTLRSPVCISIARLVKDGVRLRLRKT